MDGLIAGVLVVATAITPLPVPDSGIENGTARAKTLLEQGKLVEGRTLLHAIILTRPEDLENYFVLGQSLLGDHPDRARIVAVEILKRDPVNAEALNLLTSSFERARSQGITQAQELRLRRLEISDYLIVLSKRSDLPDVLYRLASQRLALERLLPKGDVGPRQQELSAAISALERLNELLGDSSPAGTRASARYQSGRALKHLADLQKSTGTNASSNYRKAIEEFNRALKLNPERIDALGEIVLVHQINSEMNKAIAAVEQHYPRTKATWARAKTLSVLGNLYSRVGNPEKAIETFEQALQLDDKFMDIYLGLYQIYTRSGDSVSIKNTLQAAVKAEPRFLTGYLLLGEFYAAEKSYDLAIKQFETLLGVRTEAAVVLGMVPSKNLYRNGRYYNAAAWLAWLQLTHGNNTDKALAMVARAQRYRDLDPYLQDTQGWIFYQRGDFTRARGILEQAVKRSNAPGAHYHLAKTYLALGKRMAARQSINRAMAQNKNFADLEDARKLAQELKSN